MVSCCYCQLDDVLLGICEDHLNSGDSIGSTVVLTVSLLICWHVAFFDLLSSICIWLLHERPGHVIIRKKTLFTHKNGDIQLNKNCEALDQFC